jgi:hypothetical protein
MQSACYFRLGNLAMDSSSILECSIYENLGYFPWGRILFRDKMRLVEANYDFKEYTEIEITMGAYEGNDKSEVVFKADIVSSSIRNSRVDNSSHEIELMFIMRGVNGSLLSLIPPSGYQNQTSLSVLKDICKKKSIKLDVQKNLNTQDGMSWLIVNHNFLTAINYICDRSYLNESALIYNIKLNGDVGLYGIKERFREDAKCTFMNSPANYVNASLNNGSLKMEGTPNPIIYFRDKQFTNQSGFTKEASSIELREVKANTSRNKMESTSKNISPGSAQRNGGSNVIVYQPSSSPQVYEKYPIAPAYRRAVIASYAMNLSVVSDSETFTSAGDIVEVVDGSLDERGKFIKTKMTSGKYLVLRKGYHFKRDIMSGLCAFQTTIQLMSNTSNLGKD